jgi:hypothetical protein
MNEFEAAEWLGCDVEYFLKNWAKWQVQEWSETDKQMIIWKHIWNSGLKNVYQDKVAA